MLCDDALLGLRHPGALVGETARVLPAGGRVVLCQADLDTLTIASDDTQLTRRLIRAYFDRVDGTIGRRLADLVASSRLQVLDVQARVNLSRRFQPGELSYRYAHRLAATLRAAGTVDDAALDGWLSGLRRMDAREEFLLSGNDYAVIATRP